MGPGGFKRRHHPQILYAQIALLIATDMLRHLRRNDTASAADPPARFRGGNASQFSNHSNAGAVIDGPSMAKLVNRGHPQCYWFRALVRLAWQACLLIILIQRIGAGFMSFANYLTPIWAVIMGAVIFGERLSVSAFVALGVILLGRCH